MNKKQIRKLAAIMFTDIAGYTALSSKDENKALEYATKENHNNSKSYANMQIGAVFHRQNNMIKSNEFLLKAYMYEKKREKQNKPQDPVKLFHTIGYLIMNFSMLGLEDSMYVYEQEYIANASKLNDVNLRTCYRRLKEWYANVDNNEAVLKYELLFEKLDQKINN